MLTLCVDIIFFRGMHYHLYGHGPDTNKDFDQLTEDYGEHCKAS